MAKDKIRKHAFYLGVPVLGILCCLYYLNRAVIDVAYTDYIRLINSYLPDVWNPDKFFVADVLTRIPLNYLGRIINVTFFGYNTVVDMVWGVLGLGLSGFVIGCYSRNRRINAGWYLLIMLVLFSLNKWEMLTNGTGWVHFAAFACFYYHYLVLDRVWEGREKKGDGVRLCVIPFVITLGVAGPYCAIYSVTVILACGFCAAMRYMERTAGRKSNQVSVSWKALWGKLEVKWGIWAVCTLIPLLLYMWSNSMTVEEHAGAVEGSLLQYLVTDPAFFIKFFLESFASMVIGGEYAAYLELGDKALCLVGLLVIGAYLAALWMYWRFSLYKVTIFPLLLMAAGGLNHVLILVSRWIFYPNSLYAMSSRYSLQFQVGILGILLTFGLVWRQSRKRKRLLTRVLIVACFGFIAAGNLFTIKHEWDKAPHRKANLTATREAALNYREVSDEELVRLFQYRKGTDKIRDALGILEENQWNVFRGQTEDN